MNQIYKIGFFIIMLEIIIMFGGFSFDISSGDSMCPTLGKMGIVLQKNIPINQSIVVGDVYTYENDGYRMQHRVVLEINKTAYGFKGDNDHRQGIHEFIKRENIKKKLIYSFDLISCE